MSLHQRYGQFPIHPRELSFNSQLFKWYSHQKLWFPDRANSYVSFTSHATHPTCRPSNVTFHVLQRQGGKGSWHKTRSEKKTRKRLDETQQGQANNNNYGKWCKLSRLCCSSGCAFLYFLLSCGRSGGSIKAYHNLHQHISHYSFCSTIPLSLCSSSSSCLSGTKWAAICFVVE